MSTSGGAAVGSVTAADATIVVGGSAAAPTVGVGVIPESKVTNLTTDLAAKAPLVGAGGFGVYGDGSDGVVTFDGTTTVLGLVPSANVYVLTRDIFLRDGSTINAGVTIIWNGYRIFVQGNLVNNGTIQWNGNPGTLGGAGGAAITNGGSSIVTQAQVGAAGGAGGVNAGVAGTNPSQSSNGGNGGSGGAGGTGAAGAGGTASAPVPNNGAMRMVPFSVLGMTLAGPASVATHCAGAGGGGGGGDATNSGGGGGSGGGVGVLVARTISGTGAIQCRGGNGGAGAATGNTGGGGGGGGGVVMVTSASVVIGSPNTIAGQTIDANGGAFGAKNGTGAVGVVGAAGTVILVPN